MEWSVSKTSTVILLKKPKRETTSEALQKREEEEFNTGPSQYSHNLPRAMHRCSLIVKRNKRCLGWVKVLDRHCNIVLEKVKEMWTEVPKSVKGKKKSNPVNKDCSISKMFLLWELSHYGAVELLITGK
jgi:small nuclear ribonucleoprotein D2